MEGLRTRSAPAALSQVWDDAVVTEEATQPLPETELLRIAYKKSGLTVGALAEATGMSAASVHVALNGIRHDKGRVRVVTPPDRTLVRLGSVLGVSPDHLRAVGRERAGDMLATADATGDRPAAVPSELESRAAAAGRAALARQVLAAFSTSDLLAEVARRDQSEE